MCRIIHDSHALNRAPIGTAVNHKIHEPYLIRSLRPDKTLTLSYRNLLALAFAHLQPSFAVQPLYALVNDHHTLLAQVQVNHGGPISTMSMRQCQDLLSQLLVAIWHTGIRK